MLFFFNNTFADKPVGVNSNRINFIVGFTQAMIYNLFYIVNELRGQGLNFLRLGRFIILFHMAKLQQFLHKTDVCKIFPLVCFIVFR